MTIYNGVTGEVTFSEEEYDQMCNSLLLDFSKAAMTGLLTREYYSNNRVADTAFDYAETMVAEYFKRLQKKV